MNEITTQATQNSNASTGVDSNVQSTPTNVDSDYASKFAKLTHRERELQKQREQIKTERAELEEYRQLKEKAKLNPNEVLSKFGISYGELTEKMLTPSDDKLTTLEQRIAKFEDEKREAALQEREREDKQAYENGLGVIKKYIDDNSDTYEYIQMNNAHDEVMELALKYFKETGKYLSFKECADLVEKHFEDDYDRIVQSKKLQAKFQKGESKEGNPVGTQQTNKNITLTNEAKATANPLEPVADDKVLMKRAIEAYRNARLK
jgi:hypothetical protein